MRLTSTSILMGTLLMAGCGSTSSLGTAADRLDNSAVRSTARVRETEAYLDVDRAMNHADSRAHVDSRYRD